MKPALSFVAGALAGVAASLTLGTLAWAKGHTDSDRCAYIDRDLARWSGRS